MRCSYPLHSDYVGKPGDLYRLPCPVCRRIDVETAQTKNKIKAFWLSLLHGIRAGFMEWKEHEAIW